MAGKKKKYNARFPPARIKKIMQTDEDVGKIAATVPVVISRALELFLESIITESASRANESKAKTLSSSHIKSVIQSKPEFDFLKQQVQLVPDLNADGGETTAAPSGEKRTSITKSHLPATSTLSSPGTSAREGMLLARKRSRPATSTASAVADTSESADGLKPKRKRGRPPKVRQLEGSEDIKPQPLVPTPIKPIPTMVQPANSAVQALATAIKPLAPAIKPMPAALQQLKSEPTSVSSPYSSTTNGTSTTPLPIEPKPEPTANGDIKCEKVEKVEPINTTAAEFKASILHPSSAGSAAITNPSALMPNTLTASGLSTGMPYAVSGYKPGGNSTLAAPRIALAPNMGTNKVPTIAANVIQTIPSHKPFVPNSVASETEQTQLSEVDSEGSGVESIFETNTTMGLPASAKARLIRPAHTGNHTSCYKDPSLGLNMTNPQTPGNTGLYNNLSPTSQPIDLSTKLDST